MRHERKPTKPPAFVPPTSNRRPFDYHEEKPRTIDEATANVEGKYAYGGVIEEIDEVLDPLGVKVGWLEETAADRRARQWEDLYEIMRRQDERDGGMDSA